MNVHCKQNIYKKSHDNLSDAAIVTKILSSYPTNFCNFRLSVDREKQTIVNLTHEECAQKQKGELTSTNAFVITRKIKQDIVYCYRC